MLTLSLIAITIAVTLALHRLILKLVSYVLFASAVYALLRGLREAYSFDYAGLAPALSAAIVGGLLGFVLVGMLCGAFIRHMLIRFYLKEAIAKQKQIAKSGRLW